MPLLLLLFSIDHFFRFHLFSLLLSRFIDAAIIAAAISPFSARRFVTPFSPFAAPDAFMP